MGILFRLALIALIIYLVVRSFVKSGVERELNKRERENSSFKTKNGKKVSKDVGEFVDYEEVD